MASYNNIFEVLQKVAENASSSEKLFGILKENGYKGTLEDAGREILKAEQVVLENLTSDDLKNIAGGKSLMNEKLKKIIAVGGASLMAGSATVPSQATTNKKNQEDTSTKLLNHIKNNKVHSAFTGGFALTTVSLAIYAAKLGTELRNQKNNSTANHVKRGTLNEFLKSIPAGNDILELVHLNLQNPAVKQLLDVSLKNEEKGKEDLKGDQPTTAEIHITKGGNKDEGFCAAGRILEGLDGKDLTIDKLTTYMAYKAGGAGELTLTAAARANEQAFKTLDQDNDLSSYEQSGLNEYGLMIKKVLEQYLIEQLCAKYNVKAAKQEETEIEINEKNEIVEETEQERQNETVDILETLTRLNFQTADSKKTIKVNFYTTEELSTTANIGSVQTQDVWITLEKGDAENAPAVLDSLQGKKGTLHQMICHLVRVCAINNELTEIGKTMPEISGDTIKAYADDVFNAQGKEYIQSIETNLKTAYETGKIQSETSIEIV